MNLQRPTIETILKQTLRSGLGIDAAKNHTGLCIWNGEKVETFGFALDEIDENNPHWEFDMRTDFKNKLLSYIQDKHFQVIIIEDCYGGENFDTVRKLLAIQTVIDELLYECRVSCNEFYRRKEAAWLSDVRKLFKSGVGVKSKLATQEVLEYLDFDFYMEHKDDPDNEKDAKRLGIPSKESIFFEDRCDATAQLLSVAVQKLSLDKKEEKKLGIKDVKMFYLETANPSELYNIPELEDAEFIDVGLKTQNIQGSILNCVESQPKGIFRAHLPVDKIGIFGIKNKFPFYTSGDGWLFFYRKDLKE